MAPKPASTAGKAPASSTATKQPSASKAPAAAKKTSKKTAPAADGEKKKRKKTRKETYSSYIYKGALHTLIFRHQLILPQFSSKSTQTRVSRTKRWLFSTRS
jgi:hypothetical protein